MKRKRFMISSLLAAGFLPLKPAEALPIGPTSTPAGNDKGKLFETFKLSHKYTLAGHRSHSSHSSHSSHRSSSGGGYIYPPSYNSPTTTYTQPSYPSTPSYPSAPTYPAPSQSRPIIGDPSLTPLPGNSEKFKNIVRQVQVAMIAFGYYNGAVTGIMDTQTRSSISRMQSDYNLKVTGTITPELLNSLKIVAQ